MVIKQYYKLIRKGKIVQINYTAYMNSTGYSTSSQDYILSMLRVKPDLDIKVHYANGSITTGVSSNRKQLFSSLNKKETRLPSVNIYHTIPSRYRHAPGSSKHLGLCVFESINPPQEWIDTMNNMDGIITASEFNKSTFEAHGLKTKIDVIPHCFDPKLFHRDVKSRGRYKQTTFISIGTWKDRKNWKLLIQSWYEAFEARNNVCLLVKTDKPNKFKRMVQEVKQNSVWRSKSTAPIYCEENPICDFEEIPKFMKKGDIYISTSLGEGFGLGGLHAMALNIPVITTRFGGSLQYAKPDLCTYLEPSKYRRVAIMDKIPQLSNCIWPQLEMQDVVNKMRYVLMNVKDREQRAEKAYKSVHENYSYDTIGKLFLELLELL